ncbi:uncharacterized protein B0I36DRAFT_313583 [Microdochium trichocladiopsis]|uniref:EGF-like domain-containing protein n=1 Tax=Microdochium trichocladiopsis TaxID=1682393 RepID=A0A9P8YE59_9PEZI|nr:uncharacterized protein B0I36DRAFT_313583 [Microdochium trichocladiopsis]KAH7037232.1 hypothetical protein B0I36DRAFT_313583 [Microdochium trichocladiopsis]
MSQYQGGDGSGFPGSVRRARELAEAGLSDATRERPQAPRSMQGKDGQIAVPISRPSPMPQWPLPGSIQSPVTPNVEPYRPPEGSRPPQRPPRPSVVPSILDGSKVQDHTPVFQYTPQDMRSSQISMTDTLGSPVDERGSRPLTQSSVGSIPDFPLPVAGGLQPPPQTAGPPRRSVNLGPPPSSRRGASSFYSTASFVSPIPEESPRRSRSSIASSAAIPSSFGNGSPGYSPDGAYFDDAIIEESVYGDSIEERGLVRSASIGKRGKPSIVTTKGMDKADPMPRPNSRLVPSSSSRDGSSFLDGASSSSGDGSINRAKAGGIGLTTNTVLSAYEAASASDPSTIMSPKGRMSALRRPPRLDIDAVREAEARGSLTSLPDLIKRATRLAALMDKGRRPASRFDDLMFTSEDVQARRDRDFRDSEKYQSGLSDMLAAFPPPAATSRQSTRQSAAWPFGLSGGAPNAPMDEKRRAEEGNAPKRKRGCCCGLPKWAICLIVLILLCVIAAAVVVPLKLIVFKDKPATPAAALETCQNQVNCQNGGTNVITNGVCGCICSNGFTGPTCTIASSQGCTTTTINTTSSTSGQVTLGQAIPRLLEEARSNFSIPLSTSEVLAKFSSSNLTCTTQNALVTFGGQNLELSGALLQEAVVDNNNNIPTITTVIPGLDLTLTLRASEILVTTLTEPTTLTGSISTILTRVVTMSQDVSRPSGSPTSTDGSTPTSTPTKTSTGSSMTPAPTSTFQVTDTTLDFARVAVLFILQETTLNQVASSQNLLQKFFTKARPSAGGVTVEEARKVSLGPGMTIDFVDLFINLGNGNIGGGPAPSRRRRLKP